MRIGQGEWYTTTAWRGVATVAVLLYTTHVHGVELPLHVQQSRRFFKRIPCNSAAQGRADKTIQSTQTEDNSLVDEACTPLLIAPKSRGRPYG